MSGLFIAGTDTEIGKTYVTCALLHGLRDAGVRAVGMKPVAAGALATAQGLRNDDALAIQAAGAVSLPYDLVNPYVFAAPTSPNIAAAYAGREITIEPIAAAYRQCSEASELVIMEGIGGWRVPLSATLQSRDLAQALELPVLLVCGIRLGCINHALLSAAAITADGCRLLGWVANDLSADYHYADDCIETISTLIDAPLITRISWGAGAPADAVATLLATLR